MNIDFERGKCSRGRQKRTVFNTFCYWKISQGPGRWDTETTYKLSLLEPHLFSGQQSSLVVITAAQEKEEETCTSRGLWRWESSLSALKRWLSFVKDLNRTWNPAVCSLSIDAFRFQRHDRFRRPPTSLLSNEYAAIQKSQKGWVSDSFGRCNAKP